MKHSSAALTWSDQNHADSSAERDLEIIVPFTNLQNSQRSIQHAEWLCSGLNAVVRVIRVLCVPYPLDLDRPNVAEAAIRDQISQLVSDLPMSGEIWCSRNWVEGYLSALQPHSLVILTCQRKLWFTAEEKLARALKRAGHRVSVFQEAKLRV